MRKVYYNGHRCFVNREWPGGLVDLTTVCRTQKGIFEEYLSVDEKLFMPCRDWRMYFFVMYNLSEIQKGIQAGHAAMEYARHFGGDDAFREFAKYDKTFVLLNGGTSNEGERSMYGMEPAMGSMEELEMELKKTDANYAWFREPDANWSLTALAFLAERRVYDREQYPDFPQYMGDHGVSAQEIVEYNMLPNDSPMPVKHAKMFGDWLQSVGGSVNAALRGLIAGRRLA